MSDVGDRDFSVTYTTWTNLHAKSKSQLVTEPWSMFVENFSKRRKYAGQWNHPGWSGATFSKSHRKDENVTGITFLVLDFDHDFTLQQARDAYAPAEDTSPFVCLIHTTKSHTETEHAFRVIVPLSRIATPEEHAKLWAVFAHYCDNRLDPEPKAASQFFYAPGLLTDASTFVVEEYPGKPLNVDALLMTHSMLISDGTFPEPSIAESESVPVLATPPKARNSKPARRTNGTSNYVGRGILLAAFESRNWIIRDIDSEKCAVKCPWASEHTAGKGSDTSTALYFAKPGHEVGYLNCKYAHCANRGIDNVLALFSQDELDKARRSEGLPAFRPPRADVAAPPVDTYVHGDDDDPRAPPKTVMYDDCGGSIAAPASFDGGAKPAAAAEPIDMHKFALTDLGNSERLVRDHGKNLRYCMPKRKWYVWSGTRWKQDDTGELVRLAKSTARRIYAEAAKIDDDDRRKAVTKHALASERAPRIAAMIELAQSEPGIPVLPCEFDADPMLFCCANGTLDLKSGELLPHRREDLITRLSPVAHTPDAKSELWDSYLEQATNRDKELEAYIRRACGYSLQGTVTERKFFFVFGPPGGMKSTFIATIATMFGEYHQSADPETWLLQTHVGGNRGDLVRLAGARLVTSVEVRKNARFDEALIKRISGGDVETAAAKYESEITFQPALTLWIVANDAPVVRDDDEGMWARLGRIPYTHVLPVEQQDRTMRERLRDPKVLSAVLAWSVRGCLEWQRDGLGTCTAVDASVAEYRTSMDRAAGFLDGECVFAPNHRVLSTKFRRAYEAWSEDNSVKPLPGKEMAARLRMRDCRDKKSGGDRYWFGVRLVDEPLDQRNQPANGGTAGTAGTAAVQNPPRGRDMGDFSVAGDPGDPGDPNQYDPEDDGRWGQC